MIFGWEPTWDHVVYMGCVTALLWGLWAFITLKEIGEIEWEAELQRRRIVAAMEKIVPQLAQFVAAMQEAGKALVVFSEKMQEVGRGQDSGPADR